jgi:hypothetical protein
LLGTYIPILLATAVLAHVLPSLLKELLAARSVTLSAVISAVLLVLSRREEPSPAFQTMANAVD